MAESYITRKGGGGGAGKYTSWAVQATNGAKFESYNGYNFPANPTGNLSNITFNRWVLNNSTTKTVVLNNVTLGNTNSSGAGLGSAAGPAFVDNQAQFTPAITVNTIVNDTQRGIAIDTNNNVVYVGITNQYNDPFVATFHSSNLQLIERRTLPTSSNGPWLFNNGHIFVYSDSTVKKINAANLSNIVFSPSIPGGAAAFTAINNGKIYVSRQTGGTNSPIFSFFESNLASAGNTSNVSTATIQDMYINNGKIYVLPDALYQKYQVYHESNLAYVGQISHSGDPAGIIANEGQLYIFAFESSNFFQSKIYRFWENNLVLSGSSAYYQQMTWEGNGASVGMNASWRPNANFRTTKDNDFMYAWFGAGLYAYILKFRMSTMQLVARNLAGEVPLRKYPILHQNNIYYANTYTNGRLESTQTFNRNYTFTPIFEIKNLAE